MIERYTHPEMGHIWTLENEFRTMLQVEILACEAMNKLGIVPDDALMWPNMWAMLPNTYIKA